MKKPWSVPYLLPVFTLALLLFFGFSSQAMAAATLTVATGGSAIPSNTVGGAWTTLTGPVVAEGNTGDIGTGTIVLTVPTGFEFDTTAAPTVLITRTSGSGADTRNINDLPSGTAVNTTVTSTTITFTVTASSSNGVKNSLTWQNIRVRPTAQTPLASGNIVRSGTSIISGVTATNWGALQEVSPLPTTTSISPASKNVGDGAFTMTVNGTNFTPGSIVRFNGSDRTTTHINATQLTAAIPASDMTAAGTFNITVFNPAPGGGTSNAQTFTVTSAGPTATTTAASDIHLSGQSWSATLNGIVSSNGAATTVTFEYGLTAAPYDSSIETQYTDTIPLPADAVNTAVSATLDGLVGMVCNTTFHYRVKAENSAGIISYGLDSTFTTGGCPLAPFPATDCAAARFGSNLVCTANDVNLTGITVAPGSVSSCVSGMPVTLDIDMTVNFATPDRWDVGIFIANDGKLPTQLPANGGASSCSVDILPITLPTYGDKFPDLDGAPITADTCGDGNSAINGGTGSGIKRMTSVTLPCYATPASGGKLFVPFVVSWDNQKSPIGGLCTSNQYPVPNTTSKCNAPLSSVPIEVVVLPKIIKTHSGSTFNPGDPITYTITVFNDSGGTLQASFFKDPIVANLAVTGLSCAAANGATCPAMTSAAMIAAMQGSTGIPIPSANLPNNSSLIFTVTGRLSGCDNILCGPLTTISNTATVSIGLNTNSSTDSVTLGSASASKSFSPAAITEDNNSLMTITFTNPTAFDVTGVSFIDTYPSGLVNAASPNVSTTCGGSVTAIAGGLTFSGGTIPASGSCTVSVYVTSATANNYINSVSFLPGSLGSASATLTVNAITVGAFDAGEIGTWDRNFPDAPVIPHIYTKLAGTGFSLELAVLKSDGTRLTSYSKTVVVELLDSSVNSVFDPTTNCDSGWVSLAPPVSFSADFAPSNPNKGVTLPVAFPSVPKAYSDVRVRVTEGTKIGCSTDRFAIRPSAFTVTSTDATQTGTSGTPTFKAGAGFFNLTATAVLGYDGIPVIDNTKVVGTTNPGTISGSFGTASAVTGVATGSSFTYTEVGNFGLIANAVYDASFTSVDSSNNHCTDDFSNTLVGGKYGCKIGSNAVAQTTGSSGFGRFVPDHFDTAVVATATAPMPCPTNPVALTCPTLYPGFVYSGQSFSVQVTAMNGLTTPTTTVNYDGTLGFSKDVTLTAWDAKGGAIQNPGPGNLTKNTIRAARFSAGLASAALTGTISVTSGSATVTGTGTLFLTQLTVGDAINISGVDYIVSAIATDTSLTLAASYAAATAAGLAAYVGPIYTFAPTAPTDIYIRAVDADGVSSLRSPATNSVEGGVKVVSGRVKIANAYGSELLPLTLTATVQYYNGTYWVTSTTDDVTSFDSTLSTEGGNLVAAIVSGSAPSFGVVVSSPGTSAVVDGVRAFRLSAPGVRGNADISLNAPSYLLPSITGRATFGVYKGNSQFIYLREMY